MKRVIAAFLLMMASPAYALDEPAPCIDPTCVQEKYNKDLANADAAAAHIDSLNAEIKRLTKDIDLLNESSGHDAEIATDKAKIEQDQSDIDTTQQKLIKLQAIINTDESAMR